MLPGLSGHLVSESYLAGRLSSDADAEARRGALAASRVLALRRLGPASAPRAILESGLAPVLEALGFDDPDAVETMADVLVGSVRANGHAVAILVAPWGDRLDAHWRTAVVHAARHGSSWCLLFNGVTLRVVDARRLYCRRVVDLDVGAALEREDSFLALWLLA